jgi:hypothetical protein
MPVSPHLLRKLQEALGVDAATDLVNQLETMDPLRGDIAELRHEMRLGFARIDERFARVDERFAAMSGDVRAALEKGLKEQTRFFFLAWSVLLAAIIGLYAR